MTRRIFCKVLLVVVAIFGLLVLSGVLLAQGRSEDALEHVKDVQERNTDRLMAMDGVVGTAIGYNQNDQLAVKVFTAGPGVRGIPQELDGVPVQVVVTGKIYALSTTDRLPRPVPIGVSTGNEGECSAGTIGCRVSDGAGNVYALSNNHVYALENDAPIGSEILQPGLYDTACVYNEDNVIGTLYDFEPIVFHPRANNTIDAAIAITTVGQVGNATPSDGYGTPSSDIFEGDLLNIAVQKYGRTTGLTTGQVTGINATVRVRYSSGSARFVGQIIIEPGGFSDGGDSGSLIVTQSGNNPVGLLFAGSSTITVANPINLVLSAFGVTVDDSEGPVDNPPTVDIIDPLDGATVSDTITIKADASDNVGVAQVDFYIDGLLLATDTEAPYSCSWDTTTVSDGSHTITAKATDTIGQTTSAAITVTVDNINDFPVADAGPDQSVNTGSTVFLDGTGSYDPDGDTITYSWAFVTNPGSTTLSGADTATPSFVADLDGTYEVELTVSDGKLSSTDSVVVTAATVTEPTTVSVSSIAYDTEGGRDGKKHLLITVALVDDLGGLVAGASVSIDTYLGEPLYTSGTGTTGTDGTVTFKVANAPSGTYETKVTDVTAAGLTWDKITPENSFTK